MQRLGGDQAGCGCIRDHPIPACGCCCGSVVALLILLFMSIDSLEPTEYGLKYNKLTKAIDTSLVYHGGRHFIGPVSSFLSFPATVQSLEFSKRRGAQAPPLSTRTAEGLGLSLHVVLQYRLLKEDVPALYSLANTYYESLYMKVARDVLLKAAAKYNATHYWTQREKVGKEMLNDVNDQMKLSKAECTGLQLLIIDLPDPYEASIVTTQVQKQGVKTRENAQQAAVIRAKIAVMVSGYQKNITVTLAGANADALLATKSAEARASQMKIEAENQALADLQAALPGLSPAAVVTYQRNFAYQTIPNATFLFGVPNAVTVMGAGAHAADSAPASPPPSVCSAAARAARVAAPDDIVLN